MALEKSYQIDINDPETAEFVKTHSREKGASLCAHFPNGARLRNLWMMTNLQKIINDHDVAFSQTGISHLGGFQEANDPYTNSMYKLGTEIDHTVKIITVFPEHEDENLTFATLLSPEAQRAMNNPDTVIIRGGNETCHEQGEIGSLDEEAAELREIFKASGLPYNDLSVDEGDYENKRKAMETALRSELELIIA